MSLGVNKVILVGHLGANPEITTSKNGKEMAIFSIATESQYKDLNTGEKIKNTEWHRIVAFNSIVQIVREYIHKGSHVYVEGSLQTRKWKDKDGKNNFMTEVVLKSIVILSSKQINNNNEDNLSSKASNSFDDKDIPF